LNTFKSNLFEEGVEMYIETVYAVYLTVSISVTIWVARTLHSNGRIFLVDAFQGNAELADSVNHLLVVGFYLINVGYVTSAMRAYGDISNARQAIELVCDKLGVVLIVLGLMHFFNMFVFHRIRRRGREAKLYGRHLPAGNADGKILD